MIGIVQGMYSIMAAIGETLCASVDILVEMRFSAKIQSVCTIWTCLSLVAGIILMPNNCNPGGGIYEWADKVGDTGSIKIWKLKKYEHRHSVGEIPFLMSWYDAHQLSKTIQLPDDATVNITAFSWITGNPVQVAWKDQYGVPMTYIGTEGPVQLWSRQIDTTAEMYYDGNRTREYTFTLYVEDKVGLELYDKFDVHLEMKVNITAEPSGQPSGLPSGQPSVQPSMMPSGQPTQNPTCPSSQPSSTPTMQPSGQPIMVDYLIIAGGGSSGGGRPGGGGGGGFLNDTDCMVPFDTKIPVTVGAGGQVLSINNQHGGCNVQSGENGGNSSFGDIVAVGGGKGGCPGQDGGSGGGGQSSGMCAGGEGIPGQGHDGNTAKGPLSCVGTGGGGGAGEAGYQTGNVYTVTTRGFDGLSSNITGNLIWYSGGGAGINCNCGVTEDDGKGGGHSHFGGGGTAMDTRGGGDGTVIIRHSDVHPEAKVDGAVNITQTDGYRIYQFLSSGNITFLRYPEPSSTPTSMPSTLPTFIPTSAPTMSMISDCVDEDVVITDRTVIPDNYFRGCSNLKSVNISDNIVEIGSHAFENCTSLHTLIIGSSVNSNLTTIGAFAFENCQNLTNLQIASTRLVNIGEGVVKNCTSLNSPPGHSTTYTHTCRAGVIIPAYVTSIPSNAYKSCSALRWIIMGDQITSIGGTSFQFCSNLLSVNVGGASLQSIAGEAFGGSMWDRCRGLTNLVIHNTSKLTSIGGSAFKNCGNLKTPLTFPSLVTLGAEAFKHDVKLPSIEFGDSLTSIPSYALQFCDSLQNVTVGGASLQSIAGEAFGGSMWDRCRGLTNLVIHNTSKLTSIGGSAFKNCGNLKTPLTFPSLVTLGAEAFKHDVKLPSIEFGDSLTSIPSYALQFCDSLQNVTVGGASLQSIAGEAFGGSMWDRCRGLTNLVIHNTSKLTSIGGSAFKNCGNLKTPLTFPSLVTLGAEAFKHDVKLPSIEFGDSLTSIPSYALQFCDSLQNVTVGGASLQSIAGEAFVGLCGIDVEA